MGQRFEGQVDQTIDARGMLVMPGLINTHLHLGTNAAHTFFLDETKADYFGANFYAYSVPRRGATDARTSRRDVALSPDVTRRRIVHHVSRHRALAPFIRLCQEVRARKIFSRITQDCVATLNDVRCRIALLANVRFRGKFDGQYR